MDDEIIDSQYNKKLEIREWLKQRGLTIKWLASWLLKSEGTVKNWFYGGKAITDENLDDIEIIQGKYSRGEIGDNLNPAYSSLQKPNGNENFDKKITIGFFIDDNDASLISTLFNKPLDNCFYCPSEAFSSTYIPIVKWIYNILNERTKNVLIKLREEYKKKNKILSITSTPLAKKECFDQEFWTTSEKYIIQVPNSFKIYYACMAAKAEGFDSLNEWVNSILHEEVVKNLDEDLDEFLLS